MKSRISQDLIDGDGETANSFALRRKQAHLNTAGQEIFVRPENGNDHLCEVTVKLLLVHIAPFNNFPNSFSEPVGIEQLAGTISYNLIEQHAPISLSLSVVDSREMVKSIVYSIRSARYTHIGIGMPLGSYETALILIQRMKMINIAIDASGGKPIQVYLGGALPTNLPEKYLVRLVKRFPFITIVRGWGDMPLLSILKRELNLDDEPLENISGLIYHDGQKVCINPLLSSFTEGFVAGKPLRLLLTPEMVGNIVASENCSHPNCTFCGRMPFSGGREIWTPKPVTQIVAQMADFSALGICSGTFTDEEALGTTLDHAVSHGNSLAQSIIDAKKVGKVDPEFRFAFSTRADSIVGLVNGERMDVLQNLKEAGLTRVFLGVETGVPFEFRRWDGLPIPTQAKRYGKGIGVNDHLAAINTLRELEIGIEIGFIPFDPLVDLGELRENAEFLLRHSLARHTSGIFNRLRLQAGAKYDILMEIILKKLVREGQLVHIPRLLGKFNISTLQTEYAFFHPIIEEVAALTTRLEKEMGQLIYLLKSYSRSKLLTDDPTEGRPLEVITSLRSLDLCLLVRLIDWIDTKLKGIGVSRGEYNMAARSFRMDEAVRSIVTSYMKDKKNILHEFLQGDMPEYLRSRLSKTFVGNNNNNSSSSSPQGLCQFAKYLSI